MNAKQIIEHFMENYGVDNSVDISIFKDGEYVVFSRKSRDEHNIKDSSELYKLIAIFSLLEIDFDLYD
ncbi:MAG: hypothetical protein ACRCX8_08720 [Sarcina sp.]